jgi:hypothetical protein
VENLGHCAQLKNLSVLYFPFPETTPSTGEEISPKKANKKTWFGYWRNDGFIKTKTMGRIDLNNQWPTIKERWLEQYINNEIHPGESITEYVTDDDEWIAEAYLETDYSKITQADFEKTVRDYAMFKLLNNFSVNNEDNLEDLEQSND